MIIRSPNCNFTSSFLAYAQMWLALSLSHYKLNLHQIMPADQGKTKRRNGDHGKVFPSANHLVIESASGKGSPLVAVSFALTSIRTEYYLVVNQTCFVQGQTSI